jgi:hypothetical protein
MYESRVEAASANSSQYPRIPQHAHSCREAFNQSEDFHPYRTKHRRPCTPRRTHTTTTTTTTRSNGPQRSSASGSGWSYIYWSAKFQGKVKFLVSAAYLLERSSGTTSAAIGSASMAYAVPVLTVVDSSPEDKTTSGTTTLFSSSGTAPDVLSPNRLRLAMEDWPLPALMSPSVCTAVCTCRPRLAHPLPDRRTRYVLCPSEYIPSRPAMSRPPMTTGRA